MELASVNIYKQLKDEAELAGLSLSEVCKEADVCVSTIYKWKQSEPQTITYIRKIKEAIQKLSLKH